MYIRKIAAAAGFACGAALAFAPLAAAAPVDPTLVTDTLGSEVSSLNGLFQFDALLAGVPSTDYAATGVNGIDTILTADVSKDVPLSGTPSTLDYELYGVNPFAAGVSGDSSAANDSTARWPRSTTPTTSRRIRRPMAARLTPTPTTTSTAASSKLR